MATLKTPAEHARTVLDIYKQFNSRPGDALQGNTFVGYAARNGLSMSDIGSGLEHARDQGWIQELPNGSIRLTDAGFAEM